MKRLLFCLIIGILIIINTPLSYAYQGYNKAVDLIIDQYGNPDEIVTVGLTELEELVNTKKAIIISLSPGRVSKQSQLEICYQDQNTPPLSLIVCRWELPNVELIEAGHLLLENFDVISGGEWNSTCFYASNYQTGKKFKFGGSYSSYPNYNSLKDVIASYDKLFESEKNAISMEEAQRRIEEAIQSALSRKDSPKAINGNEFYPYDSSEATLDYEPITDESGKFEYVVLDDGTGSIVFYKGAEDVITIPEKIDNIPVSQIGKNAFKDYLTLTSIYIPDGVIRIDDGGFKGCSNLSNVTLPYSLESIGKETFYGCNRLISITLPDSLKEIGERAFGFSGLKSIIIPSGVTQISDDTFLVCNDLSTVTIPEGVTSIGNSAFAGCSMNYISIPNTVISIGNSAFSGCQLTSITIPDSVTSIGNRAFSSCQRLQYAIIPGSVQTLGDDLFYNSVSFRMTITVEPGSFAEKYCIDNGLSYINTEPENFIYGEFWYSLDDDGNATLTLYTGKDTELIIPSDLNGHIVNSIGERAFSVCDVASIVVPETVTTIHSQAFSSIENLVSLTIPDSVTEIGDNAFSECEKLISISIPDSVLSIGDNPFIDCPNFSNIIVSPHHPTLSVVDGILYSKLDNSLIAVPSSLKISAFVIPQGIKKIANNAFYDCDNLTSITIPDSVTLIGKEAFRSCSNLSSVSLPSSITSIGESAFEGCTSLVSIEIPKGVTTITKSMFSNCFRLNSVILPNSITSLEDSAFNGCKALAAIVIPEKTTFIGRTCFTHCDSLTSITIPANINQVGEYAFSKCINLASVNIQKGATIIGIREFEECENLTSITIPDSVITIGREAFRKCTNLTSIRIPNSVDSIGSSVFSGCEKLKQIIVDRDSYAEQYCVENEYTYTYGGLFDSIRNLFGF